MITRLKIDNFKSLVNFDLPGNEHRLGRFTCIVGLNGSGKSTLLQAFAFLGQIASGSVASWIDGREWKVKDITSQVGKRRILIDFEVEFLHPEMGPLIWGGRFNTHKMRCTNERIQAGIIVLFDVSEGRISVADNQAKLTQASNMPSLDYQGSALSVLRLSESHSAVLWVKNALINLKSLELLSPHSLRKKSKQAKDIGPGGEKLSAYLAELDEDRTYKLTATLKRFYPHLTGMRIKQAQYGWKSMIFNEDYGGGQQYDAAHINDGMLRLGAILSQEFSEHSILLFDEIENGMNPELVEMLVKHLATSSKQIIVTTHSPVILNYLEDELAKQGVILLYRDNTGATRAARFFDIPHMRAKLRGLGPGEVFIDTPLSELAEGLLSNAQPAGEP